MPSLVVGRRIVVHPWRHPVEEDRRSIDPDTQIRVVVASQHVRRDAIVFREPGCGGLGERRAEPTAIQPQSRSLILSAATSARDTPVVHHPHGDTQVGQRAQHFGRRHAAIPAQHGDGRRSQSYDRMASPGPIGLC